MVERILLGLAQSAARPSNVQVGTGLKKTGSRKSSKSEVGKWPNARRFGCQLGRTAVCSMRPGVD